jgi:hypothetical protein
VSSVWPRGTLCTAAFIMLALAASAAAQQPPRPIRSGAEALRQLGDVPWYDAQLDELRPVEVAPPRAPPPRPDVAENLVSRSKEDEKGDGQDGEKAATAAGSLFSYVMLLLGLGALSIALLVVLNLMIRTFITRRGATSASDDVRSSSRVDRIEQLPVNLRRARSDLLGEARRHYEAGQYNEAMIYLYSYMLVELDKSQHIRLLHGKTNRQYLWELRRSPELRQLVAQAMIAFEDVFFGGHNLDRSRFEACYGALDAFHQQTEPAAV